MLLTMVPSRKLFSGLGRSGWLAELEPSPCGRLARHGKGGRSVARAWHVHGMHGHSLFSLLTGPPQRIANPQRLATVQVRGHTRLPCKRDANPKQGRRPARTPCPTRGQATERLVRAAYWKILEVERGRAPRPRRPPGVVVHPGTTP